MKVVPIRMPWAFCVFACGKDVENREEMTTVRGRVLIHALKKPCGETKEILADLFEAGKLAEEDVRLWRNIEKAWCGHIVGEVTLVDCTLDYESTWAKPYRWHWVLKDPVLFKTFIPVSDRDTIWSYSGKIDG